MVLLFMTEKSRKSIIKIIQHAEQILLYTDGITQPQFEGNRLVLEAVAFNVSQIGELAKLVDQQTIDENRHVDWMAMRGLRNRIVHDYDHVSPSIIWAVIQNDLPQLISDLNTILGN